MKMRFAALAALTTALAACSPAPAPETTADTIPSPATAPAAEASADSEATRAYKRANDAMHAGMGMGFTGDADVDFMRGMIPHHQGAIDMAEIVLEYGKDPEVRALAQQVIAAQNEEIAMMQRWLEARGVAADAPAADDDAHAHAHH